MSDTPTLEELIADHQPTTMRRDHPTRRGFLVNVTACTADGCEWTGRLDAGHASHADHVAAVIREHWHIVAKAEAVVDEYGNETVPVATDRPQDNPHLRVDPVDPWGDRPIQPLGIPTPYRTPEAARRMAAALLSAADRAEAKQ